MRLHSRSDFLWEDNLVAIISFSMNRPNYLQVCPVQLKKYKSVSERFNKVITIINGIATFDDMEIKDGSMMIEERT